LRVVVRIEPIRFSMALVVESERVSVVGDAPSGVENVI